MSGVDEVWVPDACTLPTLEQPLRLAEFDSLFATGLVSQTRIAPHVLRWSLDPNAEDVARDLTARETECCTFFRFNFIAEPPALLVDVHVPTAQVKVLDALAARAAAGMAAA
jgi:hypothetical protein